MILEHLLFSAGVAILISVIAEQWFYTKVPWIITFLVVGLLDTDYIFQTVFFTVCNYKTPLIQHGDFHNLFSIMCISYLVAKIAHKYYQLPLKTSFVCAVIGLVTHLACDFFVYPNTCKLLYPFSSIQSRGIAILHETQSFYGLGEKSIFIAGTVFLVVALVIKFYYSENKWIETQTQYREEG